ncbi:ABC-type phosphate/phosphonate transport system permease subunit [Bradyrhizobium elkanii]|uniref:ABC-type phosphate/phosphonate transport system permease subunit n=2 Tax=Bacteria TaxID=2 RepID=A0ABV4EV42_BRAEL
MSQLPKPDTPELRAKYPDAFDRPASARLALPAMIVAAFAIFVFGLVDLDFSPSRLIAGLSQLGWITMLMIPPNPGSSFPLYMQALGETLSIALLGTTLAALLALPVSLLAARNIIPSNLIRFPVRRFLDSIRGVDTLIWALVWINVVGLGPFAGVLAIMVSDFGAFGKLFSEAIEAADRKQVEGIRALRRQPAARDPLRPAAAGAARDRRAGALLHRVQHPFGDHHRHRRRRRHRLATRRADPRAGMAEGVVPDPDDPDRGCRDRFHLQQAALCDHRAKGGGVASSSPLPACGQRPEFSRSANSG